MRKNKHKAIFFDTGKRWRKIKLASIVLVIFLMTAAGASGYAYYYSPFQENNPNFSKKDTERKVEEINNKSLPVVNQGTFISIDKVYDNTYIRRFGEEKRKVILTFDDGPDPRFTEKILDVLSEEKVNGTFFVTGEQVYKYPSIGHKILQQGSDMGAHTFSHYENKEDKKLDERTFMREMDFTEKIFAYHYGYKTKLFRVPYLGLEDHLSYNSLQYIREAYKRGMTISAPTVDTEDWNEKNDYKKIAKLGTTSDVQTVVILLHDAGGDRTKTIKALPEIINFYKKRGYTFSTVSELAGQYHLPYKEELTMKDKISTFLTFHAYNSFVKAPQLLDKGFVIGFIFVFLHMGIFSLLAITEKIKKVGNKLPYKKSKRAFKSLISVIVPMHNEEHAIRQTIRAILRNSYKKFELIIVDDGSTDRSIERVKPLLKDPRIRLLTKSNGGKFSALNYGITHAKGRFSVFVDSDTRLAKNALKKITKYFSDKRVGAVAGNIKVGNKSNLLARLQSIEYISSQSIEKRAYELFGSVLIVPGAFGAWRTSVIRKAGLFSYKTHAEDFDLTLSIIKKGYKVRFCEDAIAHTEAPLTLKQFYKQRVRWNFGNLQVFFKHIDMFFNKKFGVLGMIFLPRLASVVVATFLLTPFIDIFVILNLFIGERTLTLSFLTFYFTVQLSFTYLAYALMKEKLVNPFLIVVIWLAYTRLTYVCLSAAIMQALKGEIITWSSLHHTGKLSIKYDKAM